MGTKDLSFNGETFQKQWGLVSKIPGGKTLFSKVAGQLAPYSGTIDAKIQEVDHGYAKLLMTDHRKVRNHLNCIHAVAMVNLGEMTSTIAVASIMPEPLRGIPVGLSIEYFKKARGTLTAETKCPPLEKEGVVPVEVEIKNSSQEIVSKVIVNWKIGRKK